MKKELEMIDRILLKYLIKAAKEEKNEKAMVCFNESIKAVYKIQEMNKQTKYPSWHDCIKMEMAVEQLGNDLFAGIKHLKSRHSRNIERLSALLLNLTAQMRREIALEIQKAKAAA